MLLDHLGRIKDGARDVYSLANLSSWIEKNIYLEGKLMNMSGAYSFQKEIVDNTSRVVNTSKPAQVGLTTVTAAYFLAALATQKKFNTIYALPTASDAAKLTTTKINPIIQGSPRLRMLLSKDVDSVELKQIGHNFLYTRGSKSETAALSVSADCLVADEIDRADPDTLTQFRSRLQASQLAIIKQFSTPTIRGVGISKAAEASKRMRSFVTCSHCSHKWLPNYWQDIKIPGYVGELELLNKFNIKDVAWQKAHWHCPNCGRDPKLTRHSTEWVCENPTENYEATTYYLTPASCNEVLKPAYLVRTSTEFNKRSEWTNQVLGEVADDSEDQISTDEVNAALVHTDLNSSEVHYFGADMGLICWVAIGRLTQAGEMLVVHREGVPISNFIERRATLMRDYRCAVSVHDAFPYTSEIMRICDFDPNAYGCTFSVSKSVELFTIQQKEEDAEEGKLNLRLVKANRTRVLDEVMLQFKEGRILVQKKGDDVDGQFHQHLLSMKRTAVYKNDELQYVWQKTDGEDHQHFALAYLFIACKLRGTVEPSMTGALGLVSAFRLKSKALFA